MKLYFYDRLPLPVKKLYCVISYHSDTARCTPVIRMLRFHFHFPAGEKQGTYRLLTQAVLSCLGDVS